MDRLRLEGLHAGGHLTARERDALLRLVDAGVTDPCTAGCPPGLAKLWYAHLPPSAHLGKHIDDVRAMIVDRGKRTPVHYGIAVALGKMRDCAPLDDYLGEWLAVVGAVAPPSSRTHVVEALAWRWLVSMGEFGDDTKEMPCGDAPTASAARAEPRRLLALLHTFRRQFSLRSFVPPELVDAIATANGWWAEGDDLRSDTFVHACVEGMLDEHEWAPRAAVVEDVHGVDLDDAERAVARMIDHDELVALDAVDGLTTPGIAATSRRVKTAVTTRFLDKDDEEDDRWTDDFRASLEPEQAAVYDRVVRGARLTLCIAPAGTGKTHTAGAIARAAVRAADDDDEEAVLCVAPSWKAVSVLRAKLAAVGRVGFRTVQGLVATATPPTPRLLVVDELSMVTMPHLDRLLATYAATETTRLLLLGDDAQLPCIGRGAPIADLATVVPPLRLTTCMRAEGRALVEAAMAIRAGTPVTPVAGEVEVDGTNSSLEAIAARVVNTAPWEDDWVQIITAQNNHVHKINELAQARLVRRTAHTACVSGCVVGDVVIVTHNTERYKNGTLGVVAELENARPDGKKRARHEAKGVAIVRVADGTHLRVEEGHLALGYCLTIHKAQGSEAPTVVLALPPGVNPRMLTRNLVYTAATRARRTLVVVGQTSLLESARRAERRTVFEHV